jgi:uncharacterized protein (TIGR04222 family)
VPNIFNLTGPQFLLFYVCALAWAVIVPLILVFVLRRPGLVPERFDAELDSFDLAFLAGGRRRMMDAAVVSLWQRELLRVDKYKHTVAPVPRPQKERLHPVETFVWETVKDGPTPIGIVHNMKPPPDLAEKGLRERELLLWPGFGRLLWWLRILPLVALVMMAIAKMFIGVERHKPIGLLIALTIVTILLMIPIGRHAPQRTRRGDKILKLLTRKFSSLRYLSKRNAEDLSWSDASMATALFGTGALLIGPYADVSHVLRRDRSGVDSAAASAGDGGGCGSGSNCSSGGSSCSSCSGGGGCGGCGGGGGGD